MPTSGRGSLFRRKDDKYLIYVPKDVAEDSMFPLKIREGEHSMKVKVSFKIGKNCLKIEDWSEPNVIEG